MKTKKTIGILGGMGPEASANLYKKTIKYAQYQYGAIQDYDYPPMIIYSMPLEGFDETGIADPKLVKKQLVDGVKKLESAGCDLIIMVCNTVHVFYEEIQKVVKIPILNIVEETLKCVKKDRYKKVGLFTSQSTTESHLYQRKFEKKGVKVIEPSKEQQKVLNQVIETVMGGKQGDADIIALKEVAQLFVKDGAEAIVMGCTEIPLAINQTNTDIKLFDTIEIIVKSAVDYSVK